MRQRGEVEVRCILHYGWRYRGLTLLRPFPGPKFRKPKNTGGAFCDPCLVFVIVTLGEYTFCWMPFLFSRFYLTAEGVSVFPTPPVLLFVNLGFCHGDVLRFCCA